MFLRQRLTLLALGLLTVLGLSHTRAESALPDWTYTEETGWLYMADYPWIYDQAGDAWLYYATDTVAPRWLYNSSSGEWVALQGDLGLLKLPNLLFALDLDQGSLSAAEAGYTLTLDSVPLIEAFTDRPNRIAFAITAETLVEQWGSFGFSASPPNAALKVVDASGAMRSFIAELSNPRLSGSGIAFDFDALSASPTEVAGVMGAFAESHAETSFVEGLLVIDDTTGSGQNTLTLTFTQTPFSTYPYIRVFVSTGEIASGSPVPTSSPDTSSTQLYTIEPGQSIVINLLTETSVTTQILIQDLPGETGSSVTYRLDNPSEIDSDLTATVSSSFFQCNLPVNEIFPSLPGYSASFPELPDGGPELDF